MWELVEKATNPTRVVCRPIVKKETVLMMNCIAMSWFVLPTLPDWSNMKTRSTFRSQAEEEKGGREGECMCKRHGEKTR